MEPQRISCHRSVFRAIGSIPASSGRIVARSTLVWAVIHTLVFTIIRYFYPHNSLCVDHLDHLTEGRVKKSIRNRNRIVARRHVTSVRDAGSTILVIPREFQ
jgi:hypothetical protein